jgi:hypothetical protein
MGASMLPSEQCALRVFTSKTFRNTHDDKARQLQHRIGRKVMQLDSILMEETMEEVGRWDPRPTLVEVGE